MLYMARYRQTVAFFELHSLTVGEFQSRRAAQNRYPFVLLLIIPDAGRGCVTIGNDPFDLGMSAFKQRHKLFAVSGIGEIGEQIVCIHAGTVHSRARRIAGTS